MFVNRFKILVFGKFFSKSTLKLNYLPKLSFGLDNTVRYKVEELFGWGLRWVLQLTRSLTLREIFVLNKNLMHLNEKSWFYEKITQHSFIFNCYRWNLTTVQSLRMKSNIFILYFLCSLTVNYQFAPYQRTSQKCCKTS